MAWNTVWPHRFALESVAFRAPLHLTTFILLIGRSAALQH
jgi:hypothetical protein